MQTFKEIPIGFHVVDCVHRIVQVDLSDCQPFRVSAVLKHLADIKFKNTCFKK